MRKIDLRQMSFSDLEAVVSDAAPEEPIIVTANPIKSTDPTVYSQTYAKHPKIGVDEKYLKSLKYQAIEFIYRGINNTRNGCYALPPEIMQSLTPEYQLCLLIGIDRVKMLKDKQKFKAFGNQNLYWMGFSNLAYRCIEFGYQSMRKHSKKMDRVSYPAAQEVRYMLSSVSKDSCDQFMGLMCASWLQKETFQRWTKAFIGDFCDPNTEEDGTHYRAKKPLVNRILEYFRYLNDKA